MTAPTPMAALTPMAAKTEAPPDLWIIVPTLNASRLLPRLLASLERQSWPHWRLLCIDGPGRDDERQWLEQTCRRDPRLDWQPQQGRHSGIFGAMNQGIGAAPADSWLLFWGCDDGVAGDAWLERLAAALVAAMAAGAPPDLVVCSGRYASGDPIATAPMTLGRGTAFRWRHSYRRSLLLGSTPPHQATLIGPGARRRLAGYAEGFRLSADLDYFLQLSRWPELRVLTLDLELVHMASGGVSGQQTGRRLQEVRRAYRRAFGALWWLPFLLRYQQRLASLLPRR